MSQLLPNRVDVVHRGEVLFSDRSRITRHSYPEALWISAASAPDSGPEFVCSSAFL
jgi:hypothetical protein